MLWNSNRFEDSQEYFNQEFDRNIVTDMSSLPPAGKKLDECFFDDLASSREQVFSKGRLFPAQVANEYRLRFRCMLLQLGGKLMQGRR